MVASPQAAFSQILNHGLTDSGQYEVRLEPDLRTAAARATTTEIVLVVLDAEKSSPEDLVAWESLFLQRPNLPIILFPPYNDPQHSGLVGIQPSAVWVKPFLMSDLSIAVDSLLEVLETESSNPPLMEQTSNGWFPEEAAEASWLKAFLADSAVRAVYILQGNRLQTAAGSLDAVANHEIAAMLAHFGKGGCCADMLRYIHLSANAEDVLIYATPLENAQVLGLVFSGDTPITHARLLTRLAAQELFPLPSMDSQKFPVPSDFSRDVRVTAEDGEVKIEDLNLSEILAVRPEDASLIPQNLADSGWQTGEQLRVEGEETDHFSWSIEPDQVEQRVDSEANLVKTLESYLYIFHPENPDTRLKDPLVDFLKNWILQFCQDNGVQLDELAISRQVMACKVRVPDDCLTGSLARKLRQRSSLSIQEKFPELFNCSPPEDFWAVDILIINSGEMPALPAIEDYIQHSRSSTKKTF